LINTHSCVFCAIINGESPANILYSDNDLLVIENVLNWAPIMLLVIPKKHISQEEMWSDDLMSSVGKVAVSVGNLVCPDGFRLLSNVGNDAMQSQDHAHLHVVGGAYLGPYA